MTRPSSAEITSTLPDQFSGVIFHCMAAWCMPVIAAVGVGSRIAHPIGLRPRQRPARAEVSVAGGGQRFAQTLLLGIEGVVGERPVRFDGLSLLLKHVFCSLRGH